MHVSKMNNLQNKDKSSMLKKSFLLLIKACKKSSTYDMLPKPHERTHKTLLVSTNKSIGFFEKVSIFQIGKFSAGHTLDNVCSRMSD